ncbi:uncharacterized protein LOC144164422 isoform X4 [Haemaphysalis longicornis]
MFGETKSGKSRQLCCVQHCTNSYANSSEICFYRFPSLRYAHQHERRETWIRLVRGERTDGAEAWEPKPHSRICSRHFIGNRKSEESCSPSYNPSIFPCVVGKRPTRKLRVTTRGRQGGSAQALRTRASPSRSGRRSAPTRGVRRRCGGSGLRRRGTQFRIRAINRGVQCKLKFSHDVGCQTTFAVWSLPCLVASHRQASRQAPGCLGQSRTRPLTKCSDLHPDASRPPQQRTLVLNCTLKTR